MLTTCGKLEKSNALESENVVECCKLNVRVYIGNLYINTNFLPHLVHRIWETTKNSADAKWIRVGDKIKCVRRGFEEDTAPGRSVTKIIGSCERFSINIAKITDV